VWLYGAYRYVSGTYGDTLHNYKGCDSIINQTVLTVFGLNAAVQQSNNTLTAVQSGVSYQWYHCESEQPISGATNQTYTATQNGLYYVVLTDGHGCSTRSACYSVTGVGVQDVIVMGDVGVYPNPAAEIVHIAVSGTGTYRVQLFSADGRLVLVQNQVSGSLHSISLSELPQGVYFLAVTPQSTGHTVYRKVVVQR
jgi:hypothetical protein